MLNPQGVVPSTATALQAAGGLRATATRTQVPLSRLQPAPPGECSPIALTEAQIAAIQAAMHLFVEDDLQHGESARGRMYCDACERARSAAGFIRYDRY